MKKNKLLYLILFTAFCIMACQSIIGAEKTVRFAVPGCLWPTTSLMVGTILSNINGVLEIDTDPANHTATVTFNQKKTNIEAIKKALSDGGFPVEGEPQVLQ